MPGQVQGFRLSPQQRRTWRQQADSRAFRAQCAVEIAGPLDEERLRRALAGVITRHEILRTTFRRSPGIRFPIQVVGESAAVQWQNVNLAGGAPAAAGAAAAPETAAGAAAAVPETAAAAPALDTAAAATELLRRAAARPFDLERGPVVHAWLAAAGAGRHLLVLSVPALCADRASLGLLIGDLAESYEAGGAAGAASDAGAAATAGVPAAAGAAFGEPEPDSEPGPDGEPVQYVQFSEWQHELLASEESHGGREIWRARARPGPSSLALPFERRGGAGGFAPERQAVRLAAGTLPRVDALAAAAAARPEHVLLAAWQALLWRLAGQPEGGAGVLFDGRPHGELAGALGPFARFLPMPWQPPAAGSFRELIESTQRAWEEAADWQECYGDEEQAAVGPAACFELLEPLPARRAGELVFTPLAASAYAERFKVCLSLVSGGGELAAELHHDGRVLDGPAAQALGERFALLLDGLLGGAGDGAAAGSRQAAAGTAEGAGDRGPAIGDVELLTAQERQALLVDFNARPALAEVGPARPADAAPAPAAHRRFAEQAARNPGALAVQWGEQRLSYGELNARANQLAHLLRAAGLGAESLVGLALERSPDLVVAILGVLKAGAAWVPLDATYPPERLAFMLADARVAMLLTQLSQVAALPAQALPGLPVVCLDGERERLAGFPTGEPEGDPAPESLAYVIYTSGSTGRPKGVMVSHGALASYLAWAVDAYRLAPDATGEGSGQGPGDDSGRAPADGSSQAPADGSGQGPVDDPGRRGAPVHSPIGFDLTVTSLLAPLAAGASVSLVSEELGIGPLAATLRDGGGFRVLKVTPAHLGLLRQALAGVDLAGRVGTLVAGGEALPAAAVASWLDAAPDTRIVNEYGPTEATVGCCAHLAEAPAAGTDGPAAGRAEATVPIGRPIAGARIYLLDAGLRPVPPGVPGEIYVGGAGLARGYLGRPDLTAERFVPDPLAGGAGLRLYRTGDLGRFLPGGELDFLGRNDTQVKVRGFRVELGEIEAVLTLHPNLREAVVLAREDVPGEIRLVAYLVAGGDPAPNVDELRRHLVAKLPDYMVPAAFVTLASLPLTANGKLDRAALPAPGSMRPDLEKEYVAPRGPVEESLAEIWSEVLGLDRVGVLDSFFALGGDSIRSVRAVALANERGLAISVEQLFRRQTIEALASDLAGGAVPPPAAGAAPPRPAAAPEGDEALSRLVAEVETLSEEEVLARLREREAAAPEVPGAR
jgi:non-ribosomal peptide synthetase component F